MTNNKSLRYRDENDRAYGIAGMAVALVLWDGEQFLASVSLESPVGESIEFTPAFGFNGNPRMTASLAWREMIRQFELSTAMIMGNAMCRSYVVSSRPLSEFERHALKTVIQEEGDRFCSLEEDEVERMFGKTHRYLDRVFMHSGVTNLIHDFARTLSARRKMSALEVFEVLEALNRM